MYIAYPINNTKAVRTQIDFRHKNDERFTLNNMLNLWIQILTIYHG